MQLHDDEKKTAGYYESLGMSRYTLILGKQHKEKLGQLAKKYRITQGSVIEAFLDSADLAAMEPHFQAKETKGGGRVTQPVTQRDLINSLKGMSAEEMAAAQAAIAAIKTKEAT